MERDVESRMNALHQISQRKLIQILDRIPGKKDLIIDPVLMRSLDRIIDMKILRSHNVDKIYKLEKTGVHAKNSLWVYVVYSDLLTAKCICDQISADMLRNDNNRYHMILVPCVLACIQQLMEEEGIYERVSLYSFSWELIRLDSNLLSLELPNIFRMLFIDGDQSLLPAIAHTLWSLQLLFGKFSCTLAAGRFSSHISGMIDVLMKELGTPDKVDSEITCLVLVDRDIDYASALLTPVTYLGLLDEVFEIQGGTVAFDTKLPGNKQIVNYQLSAEDGIYNEIKHKYFSSVYSFLSSKVGELHAESERRQKMASKEMKHYVETELKKVINTRQSLSFHIGACEAIIGELGHRFEALHRIEQNMLEGKNKSESVGYIEDCLATQTCDKLSLLRLLSLMSLTQDGLSKDETSSFKTQFLHRYGYEYLTAFHHLEKLGIFTQQGNIVSTIDTAGKLADRVAQAVSLPKRGSAFRTMAYKLKLFPDFTEDDDMKSPKDMGYVFSGAYIPAVCQMIHLLIKGEQSFEDICKVLPGTCTQNGEVSCEIIPRKFLVYFIGGVTYAEIAAFQLLEKLTGARIVVAGTNIINAQIVDLRGE
ncbi:vacuolar protein sorting-associated protein 33B [Anabrus simplex]|uniref:vacuolar protein sorting-associated protein 33B n=1 Tax=Anabrus simplex TaxID=316456 RepID=UPI0035A3BAFF